MTGLLKTISASRQLSAWPAHRLGATFILVIFPLQSEVTQSSQSCTAGFCRWHCADLMTLFLVGGVLHNAEEWQRVFQPCKFQTFGGAG